MSDPADIQTAIQLFQAGQSEQSKRVLKKYIKTKPMDVNANMLSAAISASESDFSAVINYCNNVLQVDPRNVAANYNAAVASEKLHKNLDVMKYSSHVLKVDPANLAARLLHLSASYNSGERDSLVNEAVTLILDNRGNSELSEKLSKIFTSNSDQAMIIAIYTSVLEADVSNMEALYGLFDLYICKHDLAAAEECLQKLVAIDADNPNTTRAQAKLLYAKNKLDECIQYIMFLPTNIRAASPELSMLLARCYMATANYDDASTVFRSNIKSNYKVAESYHNLGIIEDRRGNLNAAFNAYQSVLKVAPESVNSHYNLAFIQDKLGDKEQALAHINMCYEIQDSPKVRQAYVEILSTANAQIVNSTAEKFISVVIDDAITDAQTLSTLVTELLMRKHPVIKQLYEKANESDFASFYNIFENHIKKIDKISLLKLFYKNLPNVNYRFECFSKMLRKCLLMYSCGLRLNGRDTKDLCASMAIHCYINGYVFTVDEEEKQVLNNTIASLGKQVTSSELCKVIPVSMYVSIYELQNMYDRDISVKGENDIIRLLIKLQFEDNLVEENLLHSIDSMSDIVNETSLIVQEQYERNPYPVWQILSRREPDAIHEIVQRVTSYTNLVDIPFDKPDILIAGCGTGSHAIQTAMRIQHNSLTAIDLSKRSLAFAKRKANEYGFEHITFKQLDILQVPILDKQYDIIETIGVLHHMNEPLTGFRSLVDILKPRGLMNVGLYSKLGRRYIIKAKSIYDDPEHYVSDDEIRYRRVSLMQSDDDTLKNNIATYKDFYTLHDCRDLIFHENENNYSISELSKLITDAGMEFIGFDFQDSSIMTVFKKLFPEKGAYGRLENWEEYEERYPDTFASMYIFWCQKKH